MKLALFIFRFFCSTMCSMNKLILAFVLFFVMTLRAADIQLVNQVMFQVHQEAVTTYDFKNYLKAKKDLNIPQLLSLVKNELEEFILFKLCLLEVENLEFQLPQTKKQAPFHRSKTDTPSAELFEFERKAYL